MINLKQSIKAGAKYAGEAIDAAASAIAPRWAEKRISSRRRITNSTGYDGASRRSRMRKWRGMPEGANTQLSRSSQILRDRSRDLCGNTWAGSRAKSVVQNHVVGSGIIPTPRGDGTESISDLLEDVCSPTYTGFDVRGSKSLYGIQSLSVGTMFEAGDAIVVAHWRSPSEMRRHGLALPLQLRVLEPEHLDHLKHGPLDNGNYALRGIEFDPQDRPVAYHLFREHPKDIRYWQHHESVRVPAWQVAHLFWEWRPGQVHGLPWPTPVMVKIRDQADYEDAHLVRQKIAAAFSVFIHQMDGLSDNIDDPLPEKVEPGIIEYLRPGEDVSFAKPPGVEGLRDFSEISARQVAAGVDLTYESLTTDYSKVNFTSARMGWLEMSKSVRKWQTHIAMPKLCAKIEFWLRMAAASIGVDPGQRRWKHTPPKAEMIDPVRETNAATSRIRAGLSSRQDEIRRLGGRAEEVDREIAEDNARIDELGIVLDSDPRQTTQAGNPSNFGDTA